MTLKERVRRLLDDVPEDELPVAERFLEFLRERSGDPLLRALANAPIDDEPVTPEEEAAIEEGRRAIARGEVVPWEEVRDKFMTQRRPRKKRVAVPPAPRSTRRPPARS